MGHSVTCVHQVVLVKVRACAAIVAIGAYDRILLMARFFREGACVVFGGGTVKLAVMSGSFVEQPVYSGYFRVGCVVRNG